jgi:hypothetical protein
MKKMRKGYIANLFYFFFIFTFGLIAIVSCGGGGDDAAAPQPQQGAIDNSSFYGDFTFSMKIDSCGLENQTLTFGGDSTKKNEDDYIYMPKNQSSITYTKVDRTVTIDINGRTVYYSEDSQDFSLDLTLVFSSDYNNFTFDGNSIENDPADCDGPVTGNGIRVGTVGVVFDFNYLQYRTSNTFNGYRGWIQLTKDGIPVEQSDVQKIELKDSSGALINYDKFSFYPSTYYVGVWNPGTASVDFSGPVPTAGFLISFGGVNLPADNYTWEVTTVDNKIVSKQFNYPGQKVLPFVDSSTMTSQWLADGSLKLSWTNPPNIAPNDYDQLRVYITDDTAGEILYASLPVNVNKMTIPSDWVNIFENFYSLTTTRWQVQTRSYSSEDMNYARGLSDSVIIPPRP